MIKKVLKSKRGLNGRIIIPPDKSISHRAIMFSSIAKGECVINNFSCGADCKTTLNIFKELGADITYINKSTLKLRSKGTLTEPRSSLYAGNSGTTARLLTGILSGQKFNTVITGDESLSKRPMKRIIEPLTLMGADIKSENEKLPLIITGRKLNGISYNSKLSSAQVKSCVLLAGLFADGKTIYKEPFISRNHTELLLKYLGADIHISGNSTEISNSELVARDISIVGDISSAAFFIVAGLIKPYSDFIIENVGINQTRSGIIDIVKGMGGNIQILNERSESGESVADIRVIYTEKLKACVIEGEDIPRLIDELPIIAILASQADGQTIVRNAEDLRNKESDRIRCLTSELKKIGINIKETDDGYIITGKNTIKGGAELNCYKDHRLAMSFYIAGLISDNEICIRDFEWTNISFPEFESLVEILQS